jgi:hypothetical protein
MKNIFIPPLTIYKRKKTITRKKLDIRFGVKNKKFDKVHGDIVIS